MATLAVPTQWELAKLVNAIAQERGRELPLRHDALASGANDTIARMLAGQITPEAAISELRRFAERLHPDESWSDLEFFRDADISLDLDDDHAEFNLGDYYPEWPAEVLAHGRAILARGGVRPDTHAH